MTVNFEKTDGFFILLPMLGIDYEFDVTIILAWLFWHIEINF